MSGRTRLVWLATALAGLHAAVLLGGFLAPYDVAAQNRDLPFAPPTRLRWVDRAGGFQWRPFVYSWQPQSDALGQFEEDRSRAYPLRFLVRGAPYQFAGLFQCELHLFGVDSPGRVFLLGTDEFGRDVFSRTLYGGQISLLAGLLAAALSLFLGVVLGSLAGFYGGWLDELMMRGAELFFALPWLYLLFALRAFLPLQIGPLEAFLLVVAVIGLVGWARPARLIRGVVLSARERDFVRAARGFGASDFYLLRRHVLPQATGVILTQAALLIPQYVLAEITLSFLGLGVGQPVPTWGNMLSSLLQVHVLESYWWMFAPGLAAIPFFLGYLALGSALEHGSRAAEA